MIITMLRTLAFRKTENIDTRFWATGMEIRGQKRLLAAAMESTPE